MLIKALCQCPLELTVHSSAVAALSTLAWRVVASSTRLRRPLMPVSSFNLSITTHKSVLVLNCSSGRTSCPMQPLATKSAYTARGPALPAAAAATATLQQWPYPVRDKQPQRLLEQQLHITDAAAGNRDPPLLMKQNLYAAPAVANKHSFLPVVQQCSRCRCSNVAAPAKPKAIGVSFTGRRRRRSVAALSVLA